MARPDGGRHGQALAWPSVICLGLSALVAAVPGVQAAWDAPEGSPYQAPSHEVLAAPSLRTDLAFHAGILTWVDEPWNGTGPASRLAYLDTRTGLSGNLQADGSDAIANSTRAARPSVSATHIAWLRPHSYEAQSLATSEVHALAIGGQPVRLDAGDGSILSAPHVSGALVAWSSGQPWSDSRWVIHLTDLVNGTSTAFRFPLVGSAESWPAPVGVYVLVQTGNEASPGGLYHWDFVTPPALLTAEPAKGFGLAIDGGRAMWTQYREGSGRGTSIYAFDLLARQEERLTLSPGRESNPTSSGDLVAWLDLRREEMCGRQNCQPRYNLYFGNRSTHNEYKLEGTWGVSAGPALDGRQLAYGDAGGRLRIATLPGPGDVLVASVEPVVRAVAAVAANATGDAGGTSGGAPTDGGILEVSLAAPGRVLQRWDRDLDGSFETEGPLQVPLEPDNSTALRQAFGYAVDTAGRVAAVGVDVQQALRDALAVAAAEPSASSQNATLDDPPPLADPGPDAELPPWEEGLTSDGLGVERLPAPGTVDDAQASDPGLLDAIHVAPLGPTGTALAVGGIGLFGIGAAALARPAWLRRLLPVALFSRLDRGALLDHPVRQDLASAIAAQPGMHYQELVRRLGRGRGMVEHHLASLVQAGIIVRRVQGRYTCYFHRDARMHSTVEGAFGALKANGAQGILAALGRSQKAGKDLAAELGLSPTTVSYHLQRLEEAGLVSRQRAAGRPAYAITEAGRRMLVARPSRD